MLKRTRSAFQIGFTFSCQEAAPGDAAAQGIKLDEFKAAAENGEMIGEMQNCTDGGAAGKTLACKVAWVNPPNQITSFNLVQNNNVVTATLVTPDTPTPKLHNLTCDANQRIKL